VASAQSIVEGAVRELVRRQLDPVLEPEATRQWMDEAVEAGQRCLGVLKSCPRTSPVSVLGHCHVTLTS
jgi:hypothetical protein